MPSEECFIEAGRTKQSKGEGVSEIGGLQLVRRRQLKEVLQGILAIADARDIASKGTREMYHEFVVECGWFTCNI